MDVEVAQWVAEHRVATVTVICRRLEDLGTSVTFFLVVGIICLVVATWLRLWRYVPRALLAVILSVLACGQLKPRIDRPRPAADLALSMLSGPAMPSSHAMFTASAVTAVLLAPMWTSQQLHRLVMIVGITGCLISGAAMIYLGGHWLTDVLVGWLLGAGIAAAVMKVPTRRLSGRFV